MGNKTCELMKAGKTVLFAFEEAIGMCAYCCIICYCIVLCAYLLIAIC